MTKSARKAISSLLLAGGLFGGAAQAAIPAPTLSDRVTTVRAEIHKRVTRGRDEASLRRARSRVVGQLEQLE